MFVKKFITPDLYGSSKTAKSFLALPRAPDIAIWTYESYILATKLPVSPGVYDPVQPKYGEEGKGNEATIFQTFPGHGYFFLIK